MKTEKKTVKKTVKPKASESATEPKKTRKVSVSKKLPSNEEIREKALEIYNMRISRGESGTPEGDWLKAEQSLIG
jgi:hypothetical protein